MSMIQALPSRPISSTLSGANMIDGMVQEIAVGA